MSSIISPDTVYCAERSRSLEEPLFGTATSPINVWLFLEYNQSWQAKISDNQLPPAVTTWLHTQLEQCTNGRLQFIRQFRRSHKLTFFVAIPTDYEARVYRFEVRNYKDLLGLDVAAVVSGHSMFDRFLWQKPLYFVCTNGKRDRCCAKWGADFYRTLLPLAGHAVWQTSHLGGHRYAPVVLTMPDGALYGRLTPDDAPTFLATHQAKRIDLHHYRGQPHMEKVAQAADYYLRREQNLTHWHDVSLTSTQNEDDALYHVHFATTQGEKEVVVQMKTAVPSGLLASCGKPQVKPIPTFQLVRSL